MNTRLITTFAILTAGAAGAGCEKQGDTSQAPTMPTQANQAAASYDAAMSSVDKSDLEFMTKAAQGGMFEVELGTKASQLGASQEVRTFGDRMRADHTQANVELHDLAVQKGVQLPTAIDAQAAQRIDELGKLKGSEFDRRYAADMVDDHEKDVGEFERAANDVKDPDVRAWASKTLPMLKMHLQMAKDVKEKTAAKTSENRTPQDNRTAASKTTAAK